VRVSTISTGAATDPLPIILTIVKVLAETQQVTIRTRHKELLLPDHCIVRLVPGILQFSIDIYTSRRDPRSRCYNVAARNLKIHPAGFKR